MRIEIHAVPVEQDGHKFLRIKQPVTLTNYTGPTTQKRIRIKAIWDTGATNTCIPLKLAAAMGIKLGEPSPLAKIRKVEQSFFCQLNLEFPTGETIFVPEALAVENMKPELVIGMDVISKGVTTIEPDGSGGVHFTFIL